MEAIKIIREKENLTLRQVAEQISVYTPITRQTVWYWETGRMRPNRYRLERLAHAPGWIGEFARGELNRLLL